MASTEYIPLGALRARGLSRHDIDRALAAGRLIRVRNGRFLTPDADDQLLLVARLGVRVDCVSLLRRLGVFVLDHDRIHVQATAGSSRLPARPSEVLCHWRHTEAPSASLLADPIEALAQACRCQMPRAAIATLDSALHLGVIDPVRLGEVFALLPRRFGALRPLLDSRSEAGTESLLRLTLRALGATFEVQATIPGVGRVDFLVDGWLIIECDSEAHHSGWPAQRRDRRRDLAAAALGYTTIRPIAEDILFHPDLVREQIRRTLSHRPPAAGNSSNLPRPGRRAA